MPSSGQNGYGGLITEVMVLDRAYCHRMVWSSLTSLNRHKGKQRFGRGGKGQRILKGHKLWYATMRDRPLSERREYASALAARLNAEDVAA